MLSSCSACESVIGAESGIRATLPTLAKGFSIEIPGETPLTVTQADFREPQIFLKSGRYVLNALVDIEGRTGPTKVSYLGIEKIPFSRTGATWKADAPILPALQGLVLTLRTRERAATTHDLPTFRDRLMATTYKDSLGDRAAFLARLSTRLASPPDPVTPATWAIRIDRGEAQVFEEDASDPARNSPPRRRRFTLVEEGGFWRFTSGLD